MYVAIKYVCGEPSPVVAAVQSDSSSAFPASVAQQCNAAPCELTASDLQRHKWRKCKLRLPVLTFRIQSQGEIYWRYFHKPWCVYLVTGKHKYQENVIIIITPDWNAQQKDCDFPIWCWLSSYTFYYANTWNIIYNMILKSAQCKNTHWKTSVEHVELVFQLTWMHWVDQHIGWWYSDLCHNSYRLECKLHKYLITDILSQEKHRWHPSWHHGTQTGSEDYSVSSRLYIFFHLSFIFFAESQFPGL